MLYLVLASVNSDNVLSTNISDNTALSTNISIY